MSPMGPALSVSEIFTSIQGETSYVGLPCTFVRLFGCNLSCAWCDTEYAREGEIEHMDVEAVWREATSYGARLVCITGGEPLLQGEAVYVLLNRLLDAGHTVLLETNGTLDLSTVPEGVVRIMDVKCPSSGESGKTFPGNVSLLNSRDEVKFVVADRADFDWAVEFVRDNGLADGPEILFSPVHGRLGATVLADWILESGVQARLQLQLHKVLWPGRERAV